MYSTWVAPIKYRANCILIRKPNNLIQRNKRLVMNYQTFIHFHTNARTNLCAEYIACVKYILLGPGELIVSNK